jgi:hypothetical protein
MDEYRALACSISYFLLLTYSLYLGRATLVSWTSWSSMWVNSRESFSRFRLELLNADVGKILFRSDRAFFFGNSSLSFYLLVTLKSPVLNKASFALVDLSVASSGLGSSTGGIMSI